MGEKIVVENSMVELTQVKKSVGELECWSIIGAKYYGLVHFGGKYAGGNQVEILFLVQNNAL